MSDISMPPEPPKPAQKPDNPLLRLFGTLMALLAPMPVLIVLIQLWMTHLAAPEQQTNAFSIFRQMVTGSGQPPLWLAPLALLPSLALILVLFRTGRARLYALSALVILSVAAALGFNQLISDWPG